jgi:quinol monooxygenase YgiN
MKPIRLFLPILTVLILLLVSWQNKPQGTIIQEEKNNLIVLVKYKTQPLKSEDAISGLTKLIEAVKEEPHFVNIVLHIDLNDDSNILLYEEWSDAAYYNGDHLNTKHLQSFMTDSRAFLAGPPEISQWKIEKRFGSR